MNFKLLGKIMGKILILEGCLMAVPLLVSFLHGESLNHKLAFIIPMAALILLGALLQILRPTRQSLYQKEGFALVGTVWLIMGIFGAFPFVINGDIPNYINALFEIVSGFTTTGASIITDISVISDSSLMWRSLSHWIGGMGILAFVLIFIPESNDGSAMHLLRAESPGPQVGKIVSKMKVTTAILYLIYLGLTVLEIVVLMFDKPVAGYEEKKLFMSVLTTFGCAGTGGFGFIPGSMELMNPFSQYVIAIFLLLFGCNFGLYYLILVGKIAVIVKSEEFRTYLALIVVSVGLIFFSLVSGVWSYPQDYTTEEAFRHSLFQVASIMTTAGFSTTDFNVWPAVAKAVIFILMFFGAMAGSTAGGMKLSRAVIAIKGAYTNVRKLINPRYVPKSKFEGKTLEEKTTNDVFAFITLYLFIFLVGGILLSFDPICGTEIVISSDAGEYTVTHGLLSNLSASLVCISNVGPGFEAVSAYGSFAHYGWFSKLVLTLEMIVGRLEILPVLILFSPKTWKKN